MLKNISLLSSQAIFFAAAFTIPHQSACPSRKLKPYAGRFGALRLHFNMDDDRNIPYVPEPTFPDLANKNCFSCGTLENPYNILVPCGYCARGWYCMALNEYCWRVGQCCRSHVLEVALAIQNPLYTEYCISEHMADYQPPSRNPPAEVWPAESAHPNLSTPYAWTSQPNFNNAPFHRQHPRHPQEFSAMPTSRTNNWVNDGFRIGNTIGTSAYGMPLAPILEAPPALSNFQYTGNENASQYYRPLSGPLPDANRNENSDDVGLGATLLYGLSSAPIPNSLQPRSENAISTNSLSNLSDPRVLAGSNSKVMSHGLVTPPYFSHKSVTPSQRTEMRRSVYTVQPKNIEGGIDVWVTLDNQSRLRGQS